jgi:hypothetical protein
MKGSVCHLAHIKCKALEVDFDTPAMSQLNKKLGGNNGKRKGRQSKGNANVSFGNTEDLRSMIQRRY